MVLTNKIEQVQDALILGLEQKLKDENISNDT